MPNKATLAQLLDLAIAAERAAEALYRGLEAKFSHYDEITAFWRRYASEEVMHAEWLERLQESLTSKQLAAQADPFILKSANRALQASVDKRLKKVKNLEDAYQLVHELENSETNAVFDFLITNFSEDKKTQTFLRSQLQDHIGKLTTGFPVPLDALRRQIRAKD
jgi:rubrerythrin